jgi:hypothetical protein
MTLSPDAMNYLAKVRESLARCSTIPSTAVPQGVVDEIAGADPMELAEILEKDWMTARWCMGHIGDHTLGIPDPERGHVPDNHPGAVIEVSRGPYPFRYNRLVVSAPGSHRHHRARLGRRIMTSADYPDAWRSSSTPSTASTPCARRS